MNTILLLEDEYLIMRLLRHTLKPYTVLEASTAEEAIQRFIENNRTIELLIADVTLPVSSGVEVALLLRSELPDVVVILMSGYPVSHWSDQDAEGLARLGADSVSVLQKPFPRELLRGKVTELIGAPRRTALRVAQV
jgi:CheY-like chemotaxis protein